MDTEPIGNGQTPDLVTEPAVAAAAKPEAKQKPWEAEGITRAQYYYRRKKAEVINGEGDRTTRAKSAKGVRAKKTAAKKVVKRAKSERPERRAVLEGDRRSFPDDTTIECTWKPTGDEKAPRKKEQGRKFILMTKCATVGEFKAKGGDMVDLIYNHDRGWFKLGGHKTSRPISKGRERD